MFLEVKELKKGFGSNGNRVEVLKDINLSCHICGFSFLFIFLHIATV